MMPEDLLREENVNMSKSWNPERINKLKELWSQGVPAKEIAAALSNRKEGVIFTRDAIIGKAHRLHFGLHPLSKKLHQSPAKEHVFKPTIAPEAAQTAKKQQRAVAAPAEMPLQLVEAMPRIGEEPVDGYCKWPFGEPGEPGFCYCGKPCANKRKSFCDEHSVHKKPAPMKPVSPQYFARASQRRVWK